jgi:hypothetical protein
MLRPEHLTKAPPLFGAFDMAALIRAAAQRAGSFASGGGENSVSAADDPCPAPWVKITTLHPASWLRMPRTARYRFRSLVAGFAHS